MSGELNFPGYQIADLLEDDIDDPAGMELIRLDRDPVSECGYCCNTLIICAQGVYYQLEFDDKHYTNEADAARGIDTIKAFEVVPVEQTITVFEAI